MVRNPFEDPRPFIGRIAAHSVPSERDAPGMPGWGLGVDARGSHDFCIVNIEYFI
jgi:hypothetical protein